MDTLLSEYMEWLYESDFSRSSAIGAFFGLLHFHPNFKGHLPEAHMALRGWQRLAPGASYPPLTWHLTCLLALQLTNHGNQAAAVAVLLSFDGYLRISECVGLDVSDVALPHDARLGSTAVQQTWAALRLRRAKTGPNQWVQLTRTEVTQLLVRYVRTRPPIGPLFPFTAVQLRASFHAAADALGLSELGFTPHSLRHGAATHDALLGMGLEDIMRKGRWVAGKSARTYIQTGRALLMSLRLPPDADAKGSIVAANLQLWLGC
jgi:hypothetical protein